MRLLTPNTPYKEAMVPRDYGSLVFAGALFVLMLALILIGMTMVYSSSSIKVGEALFLKQCMWFGIGLIPGFFILFLGPKRMTSWPVLLPMFAVIFVMLLLALAGKPINGANRWIQLGPISIQPSELAKYACILLIARWAYDHLRVIPAVLTGTLELFKDQLWRPGEIKWLRPGFFFASIAIGVFGILGIVGTIGLTPEIIEKNHLSVPMLYTASGLFTLFGGFGLFFALWGQNKHDMRKILQYTCPLILYAGMVILVFAGHDLGMTLLMLVSALAVVFTAGLAFRYIFMGGAAMATFVFFLCSDPTSFRYKRLISFVDPETAGDAGYQIWMCLLALGSGGMWGRGLAEGRMKTGYIPEAHTDCILAITGEELGFIGLAVLVGIFLLLIVCATAITLRTQNKHSMLIGAGITVMLAAQMLVNLAVVTSSVPAKGMPAPFISYGGSNLVISIMAVATLISIAVDSCYPAYYDRCFEKIRNAFRFSRRTKPKKEMPDD